MIELSLTNIIALLALAVLGWMAASIFCGLWLGARNSERTLENVARYGQPREPEPAETHSRVKDEKQVVEDLEQNTVERLTDDLMRRAKRLDKSIKREDARKEAERMIRRGFEKAGGASQ